MLFNSYVFIFLFLPIVLVGYRMLVKRGLSRASLGWLAVASLFFYGWWEPRYLVLLGVSVAFNFSLGTHLARMPASQLGRGWLVFGVGCNLALLGYFKYATFLATNITALLGLNLEAPHVVLPLAISFFTFQQIAFLVDAWRSEPQNHSFLEYLLFVTFFPQLIAGPIVHHREMMPQFAESDSRDLSEDMAAGTAIFTLGLAKKVLLADAMALHASPVFAATLQGEVPNASSAWLGIICYALQIYFDFSGYSDMAIGLGRMFGIRLPLNFASPYKATSIVDFWRRWHMTLSRFLRDYLYFSLGGNRRGRLRRYVNLMLTMLLGGLWHGAGWTFVVWGGLHGTYLILNHMWAHVRPASWTSLALYRGLCRVLTFAAVLLAWVFFRAESFSSAWHMLKGMAFMAGSEGGDVLGPGFSLWKPLAILAIAWFVPNTQEVMARIRPALGASDQRFPGQWQPRLGWAVVLAVLFVWSVNGFSKYSEFIYFQF